MLAYHVRFQLYSVNTTDYLQTRIIVFKDKEGGLAAVSPVAATNAFPDTRRFVIKQDRYRLLPPQVAPGQGGNVTAWSYNKRFPGTGNLVQYDTAATTGVSSGGLQLYFGGIPAQLTDLHLHYQVAVYYKDA